MKIQYTITIRKAEPSTHTPGLYMVECGPDSVRLPDTFTADSFARVRADCETAARIGLAKGWPACQASANFIGARKPNGWDANRMNRCAILDAAPLAAS